MQQTAPPDGESVPVAAPPPLPPLPPQATIQPCQAPPVAIVAQPTSKSVELPPQYRPRKPRKQVNVACQPCRKRRSKCSGIAPCPRCVAEGNECIFDGRKDAQERNRELRNSEKALSKVYRVLRKLDASEAPGSTALSQIRRLAQSNSDFQSFARELFSMDEKTTSGSSDHDSPADSFNWPSSTASTSHRNKNPVHGAENSSTPQTLDSGGYSPHTGGPSSRNSSIGSHALQRKSSQGSISAFGNLPFSSAIKANGYPADIQHQQLNHYRLAEHTLLPLHTFDDEALGRAYMSFRDAALSMVANGMPATELLGSPDYVNIDLFFRDRLPSDGHTVSTFVCEILKNLANPDIMAKLASIVLLAPMMRWILFPTAENYARIPTLSRPLPSQRFIPHNPALDLAPHPAIREALMRNFNNEWLTPENQITAAPVVNWPHGLDKTVYHDPVAGCLRFTKAFEDHVCNPENWTFFKGVLDVYPDIRDYGARIVDAEAELGTQ